MRRLVNGILLLDKPAGMTSNGALQRVKRLYSAKKAGHTGSLDPIATGMLPICLARQLNSRNFYWIPINLSSCRYIRVRTNTGDRR